MCIQSRILFLKRIQSDKTEYRCSLQFEDFIAAIHTYIQLNLLLN
jgi:hypothetical protein